MFSDSIPEGVFLTLSDRILAFLNEHPSSTAQMVADATGDPHSSVAAYLGRMIKTRAVTRSKKPPFTYSLPDSSTVEVLPNRALLPQRKETTLADEQLVLATLTEGQASDRETLLDVLGWAPHRLKQTVDRLHSPGLVRTVHGSYVLMPQNS